MAPALLTARHRVVAVPDEVGPEKTSRVIGCSPRLELTHIQIGRRARAHGGRTWSHTPATSDTGGRAGSTPAVGPASAAPCDGGDLRSPSRAVFPGIHSCPKTLSNHTTQRSRGVAFGFNATAFCASSWAFGSSTAAIDASMLSPSTIGCSSRLELPHTQMKAPHHAVFRSL